MRKFKKEEEKVECSDCELQHKKSERKLKMIGEFECNFCPNCNGESYCKIKNNNNEQ